MGAGEATGLDAAAGSRPNETRAHRALLAALRAKGVSGVELAQWPKVLRQAWPCPARGPRLAWLDTPCGHRGGWMGRAAFNILPPPWPLWPPASVASVASTAIAVPAGKVGAPPTCSKPSVSTSKLRPVR